MLQTVSSKIGVTVAGGDMPCHLARPEGDGSYPAVLVLMEAFGLTGHTRAMADRLAAEGFVAAAPDLYHRQGSPVIAYTDIEKAIECMRRLDDAEAQTDLGSLIGCMNAMSGVRVGPVGAIGFSMGGRLAYSAAAHHPHAVGAVVCFYGASIAAEAPGAPIARAGEIRAPVLGLFGGSDPLVPMDQVDRLAAAMDAAGKPYEAKVYSQAAHGFMCDERGVYDAVVADDAWKRCVGWLRRYLE